MQAAPQTQTPLMEVRDLTVSVPSRQKPILDRVSLVVPRKAVLGIIGESGSGKTVLSRALVNWIKPPLSITGGSVIYGGRDLLQLDEREMAALRGRDIAVMYLGRIVELADNESLFTRAVHPYTRALLSAVPTVEDTLYKTGTYLLEGEPPDPIQIPAGCSFRSRCPFAFDRCAVDDPQLVEYDRHALRACHLPVEQLPPPEAIVRRSGKPPAVVQEAAQPHP